LLPCLHSVDYFVQAFLLLGGRQLEELVHSLPAKSLEPLAPTFPYCSPLILREAVHPLTEIVPLRAAVGIRQIAATHLVAQLLHFRNDRIRAKKSIGSSD
jgi:hypothetical protein